VTEGSSIGEWLEIERMQTSNQLADVTTLFLQRLAE
jgi:hypothetical protein